MSSNFHMKEQDDSCTFKTYKDLMKDAREKANIDDMPLKMIINAGIIYALKKTKSEIQDIIKKAGKGGEV